MQTHQAKRVEITIETIMVSRLTDALSDAGVTGRTILPVRAGSGRSGPWTREGQVTRGAGMMHVVCVIRPDCLDKLPQAAFEVVEPHTGIVTISDCEVLRAERF